MHRLIRPNKSCQIPTQHIVLDTETIPGPAFGPRQTRIHKFRLACACFFRWDKCKPTREKWLCSANHQDLFEWINLLLSERRMTWIWAHSAKFDWTSCELWTELERRSFSLVYASVDNKPNFLVTQVGKKSAWWIDSCNWWQCSLAELGESVGLPKWPMPSFTSPNKDWETYCRRDVAILRQAVVDLLGWIVENDMGCLRLSAPGQALQAYRHRFAPRVELMLPTKHKDGSETMDLKEVCLPLTHSVKDVKELERRTYFQGAVRVNHIGVINGPVYCMDVNSCYPSVMLNGLVPAKLESFSCSLADPDPFPLDYIGECIADVEIVTQSPDYPLRQSNHCVYPVGRFWTTLCGPELLHAHNRNRIIRFGRWARYSLANLFGPYVRCLWDMRNRYKDRGDTVKANLCKWLLNSLAGKFGQRSRRWEKDTEVDWPEPWGRFDIVDAETKKVKHYRSIAWLIEREEKPGEHPESFPAVAAFVTSLARIKMLNLLESLNGYGERYYSAVDSIHTDCRGFDTLSSAGRVSSRLGDLRLERTAECVTYRGIANYSINNEMHIAGLPSSAKAIDYRSVCFQYLDIKTPATTANRSSAIIESFSSRAIFPQYVHGRLNADGSTRPWILPLEEEEMKQCLENATVTGIFV